MSEPGEIDRLAEIARPDVGVITNAFPAHLAKHGERGSCGAGQGRAFRASDPGGWAVYNADDRLVAACPSPDRGSQARLRPPPGRGVSAAAH